MQVEIESKLDKLQLTRVICVSNTPLVYKRRGRGGSQTQHIKIHQNPGRRVVILLEAQTCLKPSCPTCFHRFSFL
jgi:hypothetical protein